MNLVLVLTLASAFAYIPVRVAGYTRVGEPLFILILARNLLARGIGYRSDRDRTVLYRGPATNLLVPFSFAGAMAGIVAGIAALIGAIPAANRVFA